MPLRTAWVTDAEALTPLLPAWDRLALAAPQQLPMLAGSWVYAQLATLLAAEECWECVLAFAGEELLGALPLIRRRGRFGAGVLRTPFDLHTRSGDAVVKPGCEAAVFAALRQALVTRQPSFFTCRWQGVAADSPTASLLPPWSAEMHLVRQSAGFGSFLPVRGALEDYWKSLGGKFRGSLNNARNKLHRLAPAECVCIRGKTAADPRHLETFLLLEASGWKGERGTAILLHAPLVRFYAELVRRLAACGWIEWYFLRGNGNILAAELGVRLGRTLSLVKMAYDEEYATCAPGNLLMLEIIERAFREGGTERIDCLSDMPWHRHWRLEKREYFDFFLYPRRLFPCVAGYLPHRFYLQLKSRPALLKMGRALKTRMAPAGMHRDHERFPRGEE